MRGLERRHLWPVGQDELLGFQRRRPTHPPEGLAEEDCRVVVHCPPRKSVPVFRSKRSRAERTAAPTELEDHRTSAELEGGGAVWEDDREETKLLGQTAR